MSTYFTRLTLQKEESFLEGVKLFKIWLDGVLEKGLYSNTDFEASVNDMATRLVDKGLPGLARKLRRIPVLWSGTKDHLDSIFLLLGELSLFCRKVECLSTIQEFEKEDLLSFGGVPYPKNLLKEDQSVADQWLYLGMAQDKEENMSVYRHWFFGEGTRSKSLFIEFKFGPWNKPYHFVLGKHYQGAVQFFPSMTPVRIADAPSRSFTFGSTKEIESLTIDKALDHFAWLLSYNPFLHNFLYILRDVKLMFENRIWYVADEKGNCIPLENDLDRFPQLMSLSDHPKCQFVAEYSGRSFRVLSLVVDGKYFSVDT